MNNQKVQITKESLLSTNRSCLIFLMDDDSNVYSVLDSVKLGKIGEILNREICNKIDIESGYKVILINKKHQEDVKVICEKNRYAFKTPKNVKSIFVYCKINNEYAQAILLKNKFLVGNLYEKLEIMDSIKLVYPQFYNKNIKKVRTKIKHKLHHGSVSNTLFNFIKKYYKLDQSLYKEFNENISKFENFYLKLKNKNLELYCLLKVFSDIKRDKTLNNKEIKKIQLKIIKTIDSCY